jgi:RNA polymerase sigma-70 factor (ECF subfamily)
MATLPLTHSAPMTDPRPADAEERELVARAKRGDVDAFATLYHAHAANVFGVCLRLTADPERAGELLQDVFVRVWERLMSYRGDAAFGTWIYRLAVNTVLEADRMDGRRRARVENDNTRDRAVDARGSSIEYRIDLESALATLPPGPRRAFLLHDVEGYNHGEIARMTGLAAGTVRAQLHRARELLMEALER